MSAACVCCCRFIMLIWVDEDVLLVYFAYLVLKVGLDSCGSFHSEGIATIF